jgi:hypothetical protein
MTSPDAPRRWHADCRDVWPDEPARWCPACARDAAMDFPRLATPAELTAMAREAWDLWREQETTDHAR